METAGPGYRWTEPEDQLLISLKRQGLAYADIAAELTKLRGSLVTRMAVTHRVARLVDMGVDFDADAAPTVEEAEAIAESVAARPPPPPLTPLERHSESLRYKRLVADNKALLDEIGLLQQRLLIKEAIDTAPPRLYTPQPHHGKRRNMTAVALASDWHVEETVDPRSVAGVNSYSPEIAERRIDRFFDAIVWNIEHHRASERLAIDDMVLWLGGDLITGYIHRELIEGNSASPLNAIQWLKPRIEAGIIALAERIHLRVVCSYGNHGRTTEKRQVATGAANSFEYAMYLDLARSLAGAVDFHVTPSGHQRINVYDFKIHFHHGDDVRGGGGIGGLAPPLLRRVAGWDSQSSNAADVHCIGHFHRLIDFGNVVVNGSLIGFAPYAESIGAPDEPAQQAMFYIDEKRGKTMMTALWVSK